MHKFGLPDRTMNEIIEYFSAHKNIKKVIIYGSRAKNTYHNGSDIDFAIIGDDINISRIHSDLEDLPTPYKFDVLDYGNLTHEGMLNSIKTDGKVFYQSGEN